MTGGDRWDDTFAERVAARWPAERLAAIVGDKDLLIRPADAPRLLRAMGLLDRHGDMPPDKVRKYRQINHLLGFIRPALEPLVGPLTIVDAGCGRSALGFLVSWWFTRAGRPHRVLGVDRDPTVIDGCRRRAASAGLDAMSFVVADLADDLAAAARRAEPPLDRFGPVDVLLALHACDVATDHALAAAVRHRARFVAVAPCCQAELSRRWAAGPQPLGLLQQNPHLRRTFAATTTDAMRAELLRGFGYDVRAVEFVEAHHTPKNTLIYGHRAAGSADTAGDTAAYQRLVDATGGAGITLARLLTGAGCD